MKRLFTFFVLALMTISVSAQSAWGDLNNDGEVNTSDVTVLYNIIFGTAVDNSDQIKNLDFTTGNVSFTMVYVRGGTYTMGATTEQGSYAEDREKPAHNETISDLWIGETEVTQALWKAVMGSNPSYYGGDNHPVEQVSWNDCQTFVNKLNNMLADQLPEGRQFRLPTEAEWEYAARGGYRSRHYIYSGSNDIGSVAWCNDPTSDSDIHDVKTKSGNELGIYDMSGNVYEWCQDNWRDDYNTTTYDEARCVYRGGCWFDAPNNCRVSYRNKSKMGSKGNYLGLRIAL